MDERPGQGLASAKASAARDARRPGRPGTRLRSPSGGGRLGGEGHDRRLGHGRASRAGRAIGSGYAAASGRGNRRGPACLLDDAEGRRHHGSSRDLDPVPSDTFRHPGDSPCPVDSQFALIADRPGRIDRRRLGHRSPRPASPSRSWRTWSSSRSRTAPKSSRAKFLASCQKYLTGHKGTVSVSFGTIAEDVVEAPSVRDFDVALHLVFDDQGRQRRLSEERPPRQVRRGEQGVVREGPRVRLLPRARGEVSIPRRVGAARPLRAAISHRRRVGHPARRAAQPTGRPALPIGGGLRRPAGGLTHPTISEVEVRKSYENVRIRPYNSQQSIRHRLGAELARRTGNAPRDPCGRATKGRRRERQHRLA